VCCVAVFWVVKRIGIKCLGNEQSEELCLTVEMLARRGHTYGQYYRQALNAKFTLSLFRHHNDLESCVRVAYT
jgi:hypothetical protein